MHTTKLSYAKHMLTGNLAGMSIPCGFSTDAYTASLQIESLSRITEAHPGKDCQGESYWVSDVETTPLATNPEQAFESYQEAQRSFQR